MTAATIGDGLILEQVSASCWTIDTVHGARVGLVVRYDEADWHAECDLGDLHAARPERDAATSLLVDHWNTSHEDAVDADADREDLQ